jgi:hypothetical protein
MDLLSGESSNLPECPFLRVVIGIFIDANAGVTHGAADNVCENISHLAGLAVDRGQTGIAAAISDNPDEHPGAIARIVP